MSLARLAINAIERPDSRAEAAAMRIMQEAFDPAYGEAWTAAQLASLMSLHGVRLSIAQMEGAALGFALTRQILDEVELLLLAVGPQWRRLGVGAALLEECSAHARRNRAVSLHLEVRENNPAVTFYQSFGFEQTNIRPNYYRGKGGTTYHAISMSIDL